LRLYWIKRKKAFARRKPSKYAYYSPGIRQPVSWGTHNHIAVWHFTYVELPKSEAEAFLQKYKRQSKGMHEYSLEVKP
jgi:hypothetical protein